MKKINIDIEKFKRLHADGMTNKEIANILGFSINTARNIRCNLGLPPLARGRKPSLVDIDDEKLKRLCEIGLSDKEIGSVFGVSANTIFNHRQSLGLLRWKKWEKTASNIEKFKQLHAEGLNDRKIGNVLGVCIDTARKIRHDLGLPPQALSLKHVDTEKLKLYLAKGLTDKEIGAIFGVSAYTVYERRRDLGLFRRKKQIRFENMSINETIQPDSESLICDVKFSEGLARKAKNKEAITSRYASKITNIDRLKQLFTEGLSDGEIGKHLGVCGRTISNFRRRLGLYRQKPRQIKRKDVDIDELKQLYRAGMNDVEISKAIDISQSAVFGIRHRLGLAPNRGRKHWEMRELYDLGLSDGKIAEILKVRKQNVTIWRQSHELPANDYDDAVTDIHDVELKPEEEELIQVDPESLFYDTEFLENYLGKNIKGNF